MMVIVGVTGHRVLAERGRIELGIVEALSAIAQVFSPQPCAVLSSLAEGADRWVVQRVLTQPGARLIVPLPLSRNEYVKDFESDGSRREFLELLERADEVIELPPQSSRSDAYRAAGLYVLDHCDVLVAVWDGREGQGASGTAEILTEARRRKLPIAWVHAGNRKPGTNEPTSLGAEQGMVTFENFLSDVQRRPDARG
jgi:hypothetical protein